MLESVAYQASHHGVRAFCSVVMKLFHAAMNPKLTPLSNDEIRALSLRYRRLLDDDLALVKDGLVPPDLLRLPFGEWIGTAPAMIAEAPRVVVRKHLNRYRALPEIDRAQYPSYYLRNFHWQSGGWLSKRSAKLYDIGVEVLFGGTADVMRRAVMRPLVERLRDVPRPTVLDVACGTGTLLAQLSIALPRARLVGIDLSRPYIEHARERLKQRGVDVDLVVDNAEHMPWRDDSCDGVSCTFLFHELPKDARRRVAHEMLRVLKPGGTLALLDSAQRRATDIIGMLERFPTVYHEPYFKSFLDDPLDELLREVGFDVVEQRDVFVSGCVVAKKP